MSVKDTTYKLLKLVKERKVISAEAICMEFKMLDQNFLTQLLINCCRLGYIVNIQIHKGAHQIGTIDSNQYQITFAGLSYIEQYKQERQQWYWTIASTILASIILPIVLAIWFK